MSTMSMDDVTADNSYSVSMMEKLLFAPTSQAVLRLARASREMNPPLFVCPDWWCCKRADCTKQHFRPVCRGKIAASSSSSASLQCSWLDRCEGGRCSLMHFEPAPLLLHQQKIVSATTTTTTTTTTLSDIPKTCLSPSQWLNCDVRQLNFAALGTFDGAIMLDPPWSIKMDLSYDLMQDREIENLDLAPLQHGPGGYMFLWVTTRAIDAGRACLAKWGYQVASELMWIKINQLDELSDRGYTGFWLNHSKEHLLIGMKPPANDPLARSVPGWSLGLDADVIVSQVRESSRKPEELLALIARAAPPGSRNLEIFGRDHNCRPNWLVIGNQLRGSHVVDVALVESIKRAHGPDCMSREMVTSNASAKTNLLLLPPPNNKVKQSSFDRPGYKPWLVNVSHLRDLSQHYINTSGCERPQNAFLPSTWRGVGPIHTFESRMRQLVAHYAHQPLTLYTSLKASSTLFDNQVGGARFNSILITPPWNEYRVRNLLKDDDYWTADVMASLPVGRAVVESGEPACIFLACGSWPEQYAQARELLRLWGFTVVEDVVVAYTSRLDTNKQRSRYLHHNDVGCAVEGVCSPTYERILVAINHPRSAKDPRAPFMHRNCATDVLVSEMPAPGQHGRLPVCVFELVELFCTGTRRLHLCAPADDQDERTSKRSGWVRVVYEKTPPPPPGPKVVDGRNVHQNLPSQIPFDECIEKNRPRNPSA